MTDKTTPSGRALEWFNERVELFAVKHPQQGIFVETIRTALLRSHAIDEGFDAHEFASRVAEPDEYMRGFRECLSGLKGIGHDENR